MGLRLERRPARPFTARGIGPGPGSPLQARILKDARDWLHDESGEVGALLDAPGFDAAFGSLSSELRAFLGGTFADYAASLRREAMRAPVTLARPGYPVEAEATLFLVPVFGREEAVAALLADPAAFDDLAGALVSSGVADREATVCLMPALLAPGALAATRPGAVRQLLRRCLARLLAGPVPDRAACAAFAGELAGLLGVPGAVDPQADGSFVARVVVGFRLNASPRADFLTDFMPPALARARATGEDVEDEAHDEAYADALTPWTEAVGRRFPDLIVGEPEDWCGLLSTVALQHLHAALSAEIAHGDPPPVDTAHVHEGPESVEVALACSGRMVGPVALPVEMVAADPDAFEATLAGYAPRTVRHEEPATFRALFPRPC